MNKNAYPASFDRVSMTPQEFVSRLYGAVVLENNDVYRDIFESTAQHEASDPYWKRAIALFNSLDAVGKETLLEIMRQVSVDTISHVLGVIDGANSLDGVQESFDLTLDGAGLGRDLQRLFLVEDEQLKE